MRVELAYGGSKEIRSRRSPRFGLRQQQPQCNRLRNKKGGDIFYLLPVIWLRSAYSRSYHPSSSRARLITLCNISYRTPSCLWISFVVIPTYTCRVLSV